MPQKFLVDLDTIDLNDITVDIEGIRAVVPHRYEMEQLNGIIKYDPENKIIIGFKDVKMMSSGYVGISLAARFSPVY